MKLLASRLFLLSAASLLGLLVAIVGKHEQRRKVTGRMRERADAADAFASHFTALGLLGVAEHVRGRLRLFVPADVSNLLPTDRFDKELHFSPDRQEVFLRFVYDIEEQFDLSLPDSATCVRMSVEEFVSVVSERRGQGRSPQ